MQAALPPAAGGGVGVEVAEGATGRGMRLGCGDGIARAAQDGTVVSAAVNDDAPPKQIEQPLPVPHAGVRPIKVKGWRKEGKM